MTSTEKLVKLAIEGAEEEESSGGESGIEWLERGDHPLVNDLILETLFGFVRRCDLKSSRVVSKKWNLHTIPHMRKTFKVTIHRNQFAHNYKTGMREDGRSIKDFVESFSSNKLGIPFDTFKLGAFCTTNEVGKKFLQLCAEGATEIDLHQEVERYKVEDVSELLRSSPNIEVLGFPYSLTSHSGNIVKLFPDSTSTPTFLSLRKINFRRGYGDPRVCCPSAILELFTAAPNVSSIVVFDIQKGSTVEGGDGDGSVISVVLNSIETLGRESAIQSLDLRYARLRHIPHLRRMTEKENGFKLKNLTFKPHFCSEEDFDGVQIQVPEIFKDTIETLNVYLVADEHDLMGFPIIPNLTSLTLNVYFDTPPVPVNLGQNFPALKRLDIEFANELEEWDFFSQFATCPNIKSLIVSGSNMQIHTFHHVVRVFPNLIKLSLRVGEDGKEILRGIWREMTGLDSLSISGYIAGTENRKKSRLLGFLAENEWLDSLLTGIPSQALQGIPSFIHESGLNIMSVQEKSETILKLIHQHSRLPSIRNLTKLRHLDLNVRGRASWSRDEVYLSDVTAYLAIYTMNSLRHLSVYSCRFTKPCCEILTKETGLESWGFLTRDASGSQQNIIPAFVLH